MKVSQNVFRMFSYGLANLDIELGAIVNRRLDRIESASGLSGTPPLLAVPLSS